jgi:HD-like signal output (HDOD) protein
MVVATDRHRTSTGTAIVRWEGTWLRGPVQTTDVLEQLRKLPMRPSAVSQVLVVLDDPNASAPQIASALQSDPALCARILHLANSPYFGLSGKVTSIERAVVALGASVLRSLAVSTAAGMFAERAEDMPVGFWRHSVSVAAGSSIAARMCSVPAGDAMCAGLLHDLGTALIFRFDRNGYEPRLVDGGDPQTLCAEEAEAYGGDHAMIGAFALDAWKLPTSIIDALRLHHTDPLDVGEKLGRVVIAGEALARAALDEPLFAHELAADPGEAFVALGLRGVSIENLVSRTADETELLDGLLSVH